MLKNIIFDFDGVIIDSMPTKTAGFAKILSEYPAEAVEKMLEFHNINGGLSRYVKLSYFFNEVLGTPVGDEIIKKYSNDFTAIMKKELADKKYLISEVVQFLQTNQNNYHFHIASGADEQELQYLCEKLDIAHYFKSIKGSPVHKNELVKNIIAENNYIQEETALIGDSINDYEAATVNAIHFYGYNNPELKKLSPNYLESINNLPK